MSITQVKLELNLQQKKLEIIFLQSLIYELLALRASDKIDTDKYLKILRNISKCQDRFYDGTRR